MTIAFISAESFELAAFLKRVANPRNAGLPLRFAYVGKWKNAEVICAADGAGPRAAENAARTVIGKYHPETLFSVGLCGGLDERLQFAEVVIAAEVLDRESGERFRCNAEGFTAGNGVVVSQDRIALTVQEKQELGVLGSVVEMEAAAVARIASKANIRFGCVKAVSDTATEGFSVDLNAARDNFGRIRSSRVVLQAFRRPVSGIPELFALWRRSRIAAARLGDFLGDCPI